MYKKVLIVIHTSGNSDRVRKLSGELTGQGINAISVAFGAAEQEYSDSEQAVKKASEYLTDDDYARLENDSLDFIKFLGSKKFDKENSLVGMFRYDDISLWWIDEGPLWRQVIRDLIIFTGSLSRIIESEKPDALYAIEDGAVLCGAVSAVGKARGLPVNLLKMPWHRRLKISLMKAIRESVNKLIPVLYTVRARVRRYLAAALPSENSASGKANKILLSAWMGGRTMETTDEDTGIKWRENLYLGNVIRELRKSEENLILFLYSFTGPFGMKVPDNVKWPGVTVVPREYYLTGDIQSRISRESKKVLVVWRKLCADSNVGNLFDYNGISLWNILSYNIEKRIVKYYSKFIEAVELSKKIVSEEKPDVIAFLDEASFTNKSLLVAAYPDKIPTMVLQSGIMDEQNEFLEYGCADGELDGNPSKRPLFPDIFCVYGEETRDTLEKAGYPHSEGIIITGQPRYDALVNIEQIYDREAFRDNLGIESGDKIALIAAQPSTTFGNTDLALKEILNALKEKPGIRVIIKPKPGPTDTAEESYRVMTAETGCDAIVLPRNSDTNEALNACDVLITFYSTVALEAMMIGKPVVTVNLTGQPDVVPYAQEGASIGVYRPEDIATAVEDALDDPHTKEKLAEGREKYLGRQFYKLDGRATERVAAEIGRLMKTGKAAGNVEE